MASHDLLLARIRGEYREMPGLRVTFELACRLWDLCAVGCRVVLEGLVAERFLYRADDGSYTALAATRGTPAKATLDSSRRSTARPSRIA